MKLGDITTIAVSGLNAQRTRMSVVASNLANASTTRTPEGGPYRRRDPVFVAEGVAGPFANQLDRSLRKVSVQEVIADPRDFVIREEPGHPDADENGMVKYPRISVIEEQVNMLSASRAFQANLTVIRQVRKMAEAAMEIGS